MKVKKITAALMTAVMMAAPVTGALPDVMSVMASAYETSGDWTYWVNDDGTIYISGYTGSATDLEIPSKIDEKNVTMIGMFAFNDCTLLTNVTIPDSVTEIGWFAFSGCTSLTSVTIPDSVTTIGCFAFNGCTSLTSVIIPNNVTGIDGRVFGNCPSLKEIKVDSKNGNYISVDGVLFNKDKTELVCYPNKKGASYVIPDNVTEIGYCAFYSCTPLTNVTIPKSVTTIDNFAFEECTSLKTVNYIGSKEDWSKININNEFNGNDRLLNATINYNYAPYVQPPLSEHAKEVADINGDGKLNAKDATEILKMVAGLREKDGDKGDVNGDGKINAKDAVEILKWIAGIPSALDKL